MGTGRICIIWFRLTKQNLTSGRIFINLQDVNGMDHTPFATVVDVVCAPFFRPEIPKQTLNLFVKMSFAGRYDCGSMVKVTFDNGLDAYWWFVLPEAVSCDTAGMMTQTTVFG